MRVVSLLLFSFALIAGCASVPPEAYRIALHSERSTQLDRCTTLGPVQGIASGWKVWDHQDWYRLVTGNLRAEAARQYPHADSVALINIEQVGTDALAHGIAYQCFDPLTKKTTP